MSQAQTKTPLGDVIKRTWDEADKRQAQAGALIERGNRQIIEGRELRRQGIKASSEADQLYYDTGRMLLGLKAKVKHGSWATTLKRLGLRADVPARTISAPHYVREVAAARPASPCYVRDPPGLVPEDRAQEDKNHLADMCRDVLAARDFWDEHFAGWQEFEISSDLKTLVAEAAAAFAALAATLGKKKA